MAGLLERMRKPWSRSEEAGAGPKSPKSPREVWADTDPGHNPKLKGMGRSYYDTVDASSGEKPKGIWDYHLQAEQAEQAAAQDVKEAAFRSMGAKSVGDVLDRDALRRMFTGDRVDRIMEMADKNKDGKIDFKEFCDLMRKYPCD